MPESIARQGMKSATVIQLKQQMKFHGNIHIDKGLWSCDIRKTQEARVYW